MRILLIAPKYISSSIPVFDFALWNFYLPLLSLGHEVEFFNTKTGSNQLLRVRIDDFKPELLFCIMTGDLDKFPNEPWETIQLETLKGNIQTFNWFCDDAWRFDNWSSLVCHDFHVCSTPEPNMIERYKCEANYDNIIEATWHANSTLYSDLSLPRDFRVSFVGTLYSERKEYLKQLNQSGFNVNVYNKVSFEEMIWIMSSSRMVLSFAYNPNGRCTQMKARPFEILASKALLLQEYHSGMEVFISNKECVYFNNVVDLIGKLKALQKNSILVDAIAENGYNRFIASHRSRSRLSSVLETVRKK